MKFKLKNQNRFLGTKTTISTETHNYRSISIPPAAVRTGIQLSGERKIPAYPLGRSWPGLPLSPGDKEQQIVIGQPANTFIAGSAKREAKKLKFNQCTTITVYA